MKVRVVVCLPCVPSQLSSRSRCYCSCFPEQHRLLLHRPVLVPAPTLPGAFPSSAVCGNILRSSPVTRSSPPRARRSAPHCGRASTFAPKSTKRDVLVILDVQFRFFDFQDCDVLPRPRCSSLSLTSLANASRISCSARSRPRR